MNRTWIVTGGAGFIGCNFVRHALRETDMRVVVVDALTYAGNRESLADLGADPRFSFVQADIADGAAMAALFEAQRPAAVVNFAAETHVDRSIDGPGAFVRTNIVGTFELLEAARRFLRASPDPSFRFLHVSTDEVYGSLGPTGAFTEETPYSPNSPYSATKAGADHLVRAYHATYGLPALLTNCSNNYGPYQFPEKLIPLVTLNALAAKALPIYGTGSNVRDWLYVEDHCEALRLVLERGEPGGRYNVGGLSERTNVQVVDAICAALEELAPAAANPAFAGRASPSYASLKAFVEDRPGHDQRYAVDPSRLREALGWAPRRDFSSGLRETVRWYLENRTWCDAVQRSKYARERLGLGRQPGVSA